MKKFLKFCMCEIMGLMVIFCMNLCFIGFVFLHFIILQYWIVLLLASIMTVGIAIFSYSKNRNYFDQLYTKVCMSYKIRDDYMNYAQIKNIIMTYDFNGTVDVKQNIAVIKSTIEKDKAYSVFWSALLTIFGVVLGVIYGEDILTNLSILMIYWVLILIFMEIGRKIPRNSFIEKVADSIEVS